MPLFVFTLNVRRMRMKELRSLLMKQYDSFIGRWSPNGGIWRLVPRVSRSDGGNGSGEIDVEAFAPFCNSIVRVPNDELVVGARRSCAL